MTDSYNFFFSLLRVSVIQILRAIGFDRCSNRNVDILTDLFIRHFQLMTQHCTKLALNSGRLDIEVQDIMQTMINLKVIRPSRKIDPYDMSKENYLGIKNLKKWMRSETFKRCREISIPYSRMIESNLIKEKESDKNRNAVASVLHEDLETAHEPVYEEGTDLADESNWLRYLIRSQTKSEYKSKIKSTLLHPKNYSDGVTSEDAREVAIMGPEVPSYLKECLPFGQEDDDGYSYSYGESSSSTTTNGNGNGYEATHPVNENHENHDISASVH